jgi:5,10-methylenetetrahydromethanopterin reductase
MDIGVNINGELAYERIREGARVSEKMGYTNIWVGESIHFKHPFPVITAIAKETKSIKVGSGIISYFFNRGLHIKKAFETLVETYGERFTIAIAPGDMNSLRESGIEPGKPLKKLKETITELKASKKLENTPVYAGASGPKMIEIGSQHADGVLLNYAYPDYIEWAMKHILRKTYVGVYAPALLTPDDDNEKAALIASAYVAAGSNKSFQEEFRLTQEVEEVRKTLSEKRFKDLSDKKDFLLDRFVLHGDENTIVDRIREFEKMGVDQVILGSPFTYNHESIKALARAL